MSIDDLLMQADVQRNIRALADAVVLKQFDVLLANGQIDQEVVQGFMESLDAFPRRFLPWPSDGPLPAEAKLLASGIVEVEIPLNNEDPECRGELFLRVHLTTDTESTTIVSMKAYAIVH